MLPTRARDCDTRPVAKEPFLTAQDGGNGSLIWGKKPLALHRIFLKAWLLD